MDDGAYVVAVIKGLQRVRIWKSGDIQATAGFWRNSDGVYIAST